MNGFDFDVGIGNTFALPFAIGFWPEDGDDPAGVEIIVGPFYLYIWWDRP